MKIACKKSTLLNGLQIVSKAVSANTSMPILGCVLVDASKGMIKLIANDLEIGIETVINGDIEQAGIVALNAKLFFDIVRKLPDSMVTIETNNNHDALIICEKTKINIPGLSGEDFSYLPLIEKNKQLVISQFSLKEAIRQTIFSISDNDNNKMMTGELFEVKDDNLRIVSLDGHRISMRNIALSESYEEIKVIVPGKTLAEINKILTGEADKKVHIYFTDRHILFEFDDTILLSRLIEGEYFKVDQMISKSHETKFSINKKEFLSCIDRSTLLVKEGDKKPIILDIRENEMELLIKSELGSMNETLMIEKEGSDLMIGFNPKFLMDALRVIDDEQVDIYMISSKAPCIIKDKEESYIYMMLPVNFVS